MLSRIRAKAEAGTRLDRADGLWLLTEAPLLDLGSVAQEARFRRIPERRVTFVIDTNPNYTNVCITDCQFCAFYRRPGDKEAYTLTVDEVLAKVEFAAREGATAPPTAASELTQPHPVTEREFELVVQQGQSLSAICQSHYGTARQDVVAALARFNGVADANRLREGMKLRLPPLERLTASPR